MVNDLDIRGMARFSIPTVQDQHHKIWPKRKIRNQDERLTFTLGAGHIGASLELEEQIRVVRAGLGHWSWRFAFQEIWARVGELEAARKWACDRLRVNCRRETKCGSISAGIRLSGDWLANSAKEFRLREILENGHWAIANRGSIVKSSRSPREALNVLRNFWLEEIIANSWSIARRLYKVTPMVEAG